MDYLLSLLDHTYDDNFLGLYNFLWDRMRAIRMDLRMQHFFNQDAISMLEQMVVTFISWCHYMFIYFDTLSSQKFHPQATFSFLPR